MYEYDFVNIKNDWNGKSKESEVEIIKKYAKDGWRLHSIIPLSTTTGGTTDLKIIFEKKVQSRTVDN